MRRLRSLGLVVVSVGIRVVRDWRVILFMLVGLVL